MSFKNGREEDPGNYRLSCFSGPREVMEQIILRPVSKHTEDMKVFVSSQYEFMNTNTKLSLTWQPPTMMCLVEEERGLGGVCLKFSKILYNVLGHLDVDKYSNVYLIECIQNLLNCQAQMVVICSTMSGWRLVYFFCPG